MPLLAALKQPSIRVTHIHLTLSLRIKVNKSEEFKFQENSENLYVIFESEVSHVKKNVNLRKS